MPDAMAPKIPTRFTRRRKVSFWGSEYTVKPAVASRFLGDGRRLLFFEPLNTRPDYYLIRVDSAWFGGMSKFENPDEQDWVEDVIDALIEEFSEKEIEREYLVDDLRAQGIEPTGDNTDLNGNEDRLGWPVLSLDSGYSWGSVALHDGRKWVTT